MSRDNNRNQNQQRSTPPTTAVSIASVSETIDSWSSEITPFLPSDLDPNAFMKSATSAMINNPIIFKECTHESIKRALIKAAQDGLRPDGKEGALVKYWNKDALGKDQGANEAQWMPMVFGIRKKAREKDGIIINAEVVYKNDKFLVVKGDEPRIEHEPAPMHLDPGEIIASYAIFIKDGVILHREVMRRSDIDSVRRASKSPDSPAWKNWFGEMAKKAGVNRGSKSVPMSDFTRQVIDRDNDFYDLRDVTPSKEAVALEGRFGNRQTGGGFKTGNVSRELGHGSEDDVKMDTGQRRADPAQGGRSDDNEGQRSSGQRREPDNREEDDDFPGDAIKRDVFEEYSKELMRYASDENIDKGHEHYWEDAGGKPTREPDIRLTKFIRHTHSRRVKGEITADVVVKEVEDAINEAFKL